MSLRVIQLYLLNTMVVMLALLKSMARLPSDFNGIRIANFERKGSWM